MIIIAFCNFSLWKFPNRDLSRFGLKCTTLFLEKCWQACRSLSRQKQIRWLFSILRNGKSKFPGNVCIQIIAFKIYVVHMMMKKLFQFLTGDFKSKQYKIQGDPNQNLVFQMALPPIWSTSDPMLVKQKLVWEAVVFSSISWFLQHVKYSDVKWRIPSSISVV